MRTNPSRCIVALAAVAWLCAQPSLAADAELGKAVERLIAEARNLDRLGKADPAVTWDRPHAALRTDAARRVGPVLDAMAQKMTGNAYLDTYVRWHMLQPILHLESDDLRSQKRRIIELINAMPESIEVPWKQEWRDEPPDIAAEFWRVRGQTRLVEGYPPFERVYYGRDALDRAPDERKAELRPLVEKMEALRKQFKRIYDAEARAYNDRIDKMNWVLRTYRGELIYLLLRTGDPEAPELVVREIGRQLKLRQRTALDLLNYLYIATLNGQMARYEPAVLDRTGAALERLAKSSDAYEVFRIGDKVSETYWGKRPRNFADYAFTVVHMFANGAAYRLEPTNELE